LLGLVSVIVAVTPQLPRLLHAQQPVTLLYAARDPRINHALVLRNVLRAAAPAAQRARRP
jgi:hypothetical protein